MSHVRYLYTCFPNILIFILKSHLSLTSAEETQLCYKSFHRCQITALLMMSDNWYALFVHVFFLFNINIQALQLTLMLWLNLERETWTTTWVQEWSTWVIPHRAMTHRACLCWTVDVWPLLGETKEFNCEVQFDKSGCNHYKITRWNKF